MRSFWSDKNVPKYSCVDGDVIVNMLKFTEFHSQTYKQWNTILTRLVNFKSLLMLPRSGNIQSLMSTPIHWCWKYTLVQSLKKAILHLAIFCLYIYCSETFAHIHWKNQTTHKSLVLKKLTWKTEQISTREWVNTIHRMPIVTYYVPV